MSEPTTSPRRLDRHTRIGELGEVLHGPLRSGVVLIALLFIGLATKQFLTDAPGWIGLVCIGAGGCIALLTWQSAGIGLPLLPLIAIQHLALYAIPLINGNEIVMSYPESLINEAGLEVLIMMIACSVTWRLGMQLFRPAPPLAFALRAFTVHGNSVLNKVGVALIAIAGAYELLNTLQLIGPIIDLLPSGTHSIVVAMVNAAGMSGYFLVAMFVSSGEARHATRSAFWTILTAHLVLLTSSLLLSSVINIIGAVVLGLFWGSGRMPKTFLLVCTLVLSFLNLGKFEMRERYWSGGDDRLSTVKLAALPHYYAEWATFSIEKIIGTDEAEEKERDDKRHSMLARMDNMQNLLFVSDAVQNSNMPVLGGETYKIIPPLLIPRILWPDKPRTHEGQVMLNVHYGRQSREASFTTYIAWGLLPEAYGNFGPVWGAVLLGLALGLIFAWMENITVNKPLLSLEGMVTFVLFVGIASSFEMVSSVLVTSLFQSVVTVSLACAPFVQRMIVAPPDEAA